MTKTEKMLVGNEPGCLSRIARGLDLAVDIGTGMGESARALATARRVVTVDVFEFAPPEVLRSTASRFEQMKNALADLPNVEVRAGLSWDLAEEFALESIDLLFIDSEHKYEVVVREYLAFYGRVKTGGLIVFHDYNIKHLEVVRAVDDLMRRGEMEKVEQVESIFVARKKGGSDGGL